MGGCVLRTATEGVDSGCCVGLGAIRDGDASGGGCTATTEASGVEVICGSELGAACGSGELVEGCEIVVT